MKYYRKNTPVDVYWHQNTEMGAVQFEAVGKESTNARLPYVEVDLGPLVMFLDRRAIPAFRAILATLESMPIDGAGTVIGADAVGAGK